MMRLFLFSIFICFSFFCQSQKLINLVLVGDKGITEKWHEAKYLIAVKTYDDTMYERLEYRINAPMMKRISYKDSMLSIKNGPYAEYSPNGFISLEGNYVNNKKEGSWYVYRDSAKSIFENKYQNDQLITKINLDSSRAATKDTKLKPGEIEATYKGGDRGFSRQIQSLMSESVKADKFKRSGHVRIRFIVNTSGKMVKFGLAKSAEFLFDEECLAVMRSIPNDWTPASQDGRFLNAYREQPLTFTIEER